MGARNFLCTTGHSPWPDLFINDIIETISSEIRLFADDCICYRIIKSDEDSEELQRDICRLAAWASI